MYKIIDDELINRIRESALDCCCDIKRSIERCEEAETLRELSKDQKQKHKDDSLKPAITRDVILESARGCVCYDRDDIYGDPEDNFKTIATMWNAYLFNKTEVEPKDVAAMLALLKIARISAGTGSHVDNWIDLAGYAACGGEIEAKGESEK